VATSLQTIAPRASAEASEVERRTARDLFLEAYKLQNAGRFAEALAKYRRSLSLVQAPTSHYRIAQCLTALGKWVEASESYRAAAAMPLAENASPAFKEAREKAPIELAELDARTPTLTVDVTPHEGSTVTWSVDGEPFKAALLGTAIRLNPGVRRLQVSAPGYESVEQTVTLKERGHHTVRLALTPLPVPVPVTPPPVLPVPVTPPPVTRPPATPSGELPPSQQDLPPPPPLPSLHRAESASQKVTSTGFVLGVRGGGVLLNGGPSLARGDGQVLVNGFGGHIAGDVGLRFGKVVVLSAYLDLGVVAGPEAGALELSAGRHVSFAASAKTVGFGFLLSLIANPVRPSFYFEMGGGGRQHLLTVSRDEGSSSTVKSEYKFTGPEAVIGMGVWLPAGRYFAIVPKVTLAAGLLNKLECSSDAACPVDDSFLSSGDIWNKAPHTAVMFNLAAFYTSGL
jgi:hypothetical protein